MSDSIAGTVTAMICVVVGLLIIGCALVPVVEQASTEKTTTEGQNSAVDESVVVYLANGSHTIQKTDTAVKVDDKVINGNMTITAFDTRMSSQTIASYNLEDHELKMNPSHGLPEIQNATMTVTDSSINIEGRTGTETLTATFANNSLPAQIEASGNALSAFGSDVYTLISLSPVTIGSAQKAYVYDYESNAITIVDKNNTDAGTDLVTVTNDGGKIQLTWDSQDVTVSAPLTYIVESSAPSQYSALYAIIPIMCILGMAYVLIRRL